MAAFAVYFSFLVGVEFWKPEVIDAEGWFHLALRALLYPIVGFLTYELAEANRGMIDLLVTDMVMPGMTGQELAVRLQQEHPGLCVVFMSGYSEHAATEMANADPNVRLLTKPFSRATILRAVRENLQGKVAG